MAYTNPKTELVIPEEAGSTDPRIVITRDIPTELQATFGQPIVAALLFHFDDAESDTYSFICAETGPGNGFYQLHVGMSVNGVVKEHQKWMSNATTADQVTEHRSGTIQIVSSEYEWFSLAAFPVLLIQSTDSQGAALWWSNPATLTYDVALYHDLVSAEKLYCNGSFEVEDVLTMGNQAFGTVSIDPVANTPTSATVTGLSLSGTTFSAFSNAHSSVPGTVQEVTTTGQSATGVTVWINRTTTTTTTVSWMVIGQ